MEQHSTPHYDELTKRMFEATELEKAPKDFASKVMAKLDAPLVKPYRPPISKWGWAAIITGVLALVVFSSEERLTTIDFDGILWGEVSLLTGFGDIMEMIAASNVLSTAIIFGCMAWFIHVFVLGNYIHRKLSVTH